MMKGIIIQESKEIVIGQVLAENDQLFAALVDMTQQCKTHQIKIKHLTESLDAELMKNKKLEAQIQVLLKEKEKEFRGNGNSKEIGMQTSDSLLHRNQELEALVKSLELSLQIQLTQFKETLDRDTAQKQKVLDLRKENIDLRHQLETRWSMQSSKREIELQTLAENLMEEMGEKEGHITHLNKIRSLLLDRVQELEDMNQSLRLSISNDVNIITIESGTMDLKEDIRKEEIQLKQTLNQRIAAYNGKAKEGLNDPDYCRKSLFKEQKIKQTLHV